MSKPRSLSDIVPKITKDIFGNKNMLFGKLLAEWPQIIGYDLAAKATPLDIKYSKQANKKSQGTLHLGVQNAYALEVSYQKSLLIERLNMFFGYPAIKDIKIIQQNIVMDNKPAVSIPARKITAKEEQVIDRMVGKVKENELKIALENLGKAILSRQKN